MWSSKCWNPKWLKCALKLRFRDMFRQDWNSQVHENSMCSVYRIFKTEFVFEKYLNCSSLYRTRLAKLRCRSHNLPVNQDRFNKQRDISNSVCVLCSQNDIGDEYHYLFKCDYFNDERKMYIPFVDDFQQNYTALYVLFNGTNTTDVKNIAMFANCIISFFYSYNIMLNEENTDHVVNIGTASRYDRIVRAREVLNL